jgi:type I restriction enzyme S subunit
MDDVKLANGWHWARLGEVISPEPRSLVSGPFGSSIGMRFFVSEGVPVIRGNNLTDDFTRFVDEGFVYLTPEKAKDFRNCQAVVDDLVFTAAGTIGQVGIIPHTSRFPLYIISNKQLRARLDRTKVDPLFAFYWFCSPIMGDYIKQRDTGSTIPLINLSVLRSLPLPIPPLDEQRTIARVLGALDDKIELNRRMNRTLEELAAALFRSWFVDFDPVVAKVAGRQPAHLRPELAALFPAHWQDSPLGPIPDGWRVASVGDEVKLTKGVSYRSSELAESEVALVTLKSIQRGGGYRSDGLKPYTGKFSPDQIVEPGELIVSQTDVTQAAELVGRAALVNADSRFKTLVASLDILIVKPRSAELRRSFFYPLFGTFDYVSHVVGHANGTTVLHLDKNAVPTFQFARPTPTVAEAFQKIVEPWYQQIAHNERETRTLAALRDTLLPKLLSGELRVKLAEKELASHV